MNFCYITIILHQFLSARLIQIMSTFGILMACWTVYPQKYMAPSPIVQISYFSEDVTPALESPLAFGTARSIRDSLSARGIILQFDENPLIICAVDWIGISNEAMDYFREQLAKIGRASCRERLRRVA